MSLLMSRFNIYVALSFGAVLYYCHDAVTVHQQFFPTVVALTNSKMFGVIFANGAISAGVLLFRLLLSFFFGVIQPDERSKLLEHFSYDVIDTFLCLTHFRFGSLMTSSSLFMAVIMGMRLLQYMCDQRQEQMENMAFRQLLRLVSCMTMVFHTALGFAIHFGQLAHGQPHSISFYLAFESCMLLIRSLRTTSRLLLSQIEQYRGNVWEEKGAIKFYCEILFDVVSFFLYVAFFAAVFQLSGALPVHLVRHVFSFGKRAMKTLRNFAVYRELGADVDRNFPDATTEQLDSDRTCAICWDQMDDEAHAKKIPCGHCFHRHCLRRWLEHDDTCPYCRRNIKTMLEQQRAARMAGRPTPVVTPMQGPMPAPPAHAQHAHGAAHQGGAGAAPPTHAVRNPTVSNTNTAREWVEEMVLVAAYDAYLREFEERQRQHSTNGPATAAHHEEGPMAAVHVPTPPHVPFREASPRRSPLERETGVASASVGSQRPTPTSSPVTAHPRAFTAPHHVVHRETASHQTGPHTHDLLLGELAAYRTFHERVMDAHRSLALELDGLAALRQQTAEGHEEPHRKTE